MDPKRVWYPYRRVCYATMEREAAAEAYTSLHDEDAAYHDGTFTNWAKKRSAEYPYAAMAGVSIGVAKVDLAPHDEFTTQVDASPVESPDSSTSTGQGAEAVER